MKEYNVTSLFSNYQVIKIKDDDGNIIKEIKFRKLSANRTFEIAAKYESLIEEKVDDKQDIKKTRILFNKLLELCFDIVRPKTLFQRIGNRLSKNYISKKWLLDNFDIDGLNIFIETILTPIAGEKKTTAKDGF